MTDEFDENEDQEKTDYDGTDPEVPLVIHEASACPDTDNAHEKANPSEHYVQPAFRRLWNGTIWLWKNVIFNDSLWIAAATIVIAIANIRYTQYAKRQWTEMHASNAIASGTLREVQSQTLLTRQQIEATQAAIINLTDSSTTFTGPNEGGGMALDIEVKNTGHAIAHDVIVRFEITKKTIPGDQVIGQPTMWEIPIGEFAPSDPTRKGLQFEHPRVVSGKDFERIKNTGETVRIEGYISYSNGFEPGIQQPV
jgi:hypothetical protein